MRVPMWQLWIWIGALSAPALAQDLVPVLPPPRVRTSTQPVIGGAVTGHVYAADTQRPARFADVELVQEQEIDRGGRGRGVNYNSAARARTALDGSFRIENVPPGDYYVVASMTGYVSPVMVARMTQQPLSGAPQTHVAANNASDVVVTMERGAVVTGRVTYDDGTPVSGAPVRLFGVGSPSSTGGVVNMFAGGFGGISFGGGFTQTDDRGVYRVMGVAPGKYVVSTIVQTETVGEGRTNRQVFRMPQSLTVYAPTTMHKAEAQVVEIHGGETVDGVDVRVGLNGLHAVKGTVTSKADGHALNAGFVSLFDTSDNSALRTATVDADGSFRMDYIPTGSYRLDVIGQDRTQPDGNGDRPPTTPGRRYERTSVNVTVGDHDAALDAVQVDEVKSSQNAANR